MTLEERKQKYREKYGYSDEDYYVFTPKEYDAYKQAKQTTAVGAAYEGGKDVIASGAGGGLGYAGAAKIASKLKFASKLPLEKTPTGAGKAIGIAAKGGLYLGGMVFGAFAGETGQRAVLDAVRTDDENEADILLSQALKRERPYSFAGGEVVASSLAAGVGPTLQTAKGLREIVRTAGGLRGKQNKEVVSYALTNIGLGGGLGTTFEGIRQYSEGEFNPKALATIGIGSALFSKPVLHGRKLYGTTGAQFSEAQAREVVAKEGIQYGTIDPRTKVMVDPTVEPRVDPLHPEEVYLGRLTPRQQKARIDAYIKSHQNKEKGDAAIRKSKDEPSGESSAATAKKLKKKDLTDPKVDPEIAKTVEDKFGIKSSVEAQANAKLKSDIDKMSDGELSSSQRQARLGAAGEYIKELGYTREEIRAKLFQEVKLKLGPDVFEQAKRLADQRNITIRIATNRIVNHTKNLVLGLAPRKGREIILSLNDMNSQVPFHEISHVFIRDMVGSANEIDSKNAIRWLDDLYGEHPKVKGAKKKDRKDTILELFAQETGEALEDRMRSLPKGKFDQMRRWFKDAERGYRFRGLQKKQRYSPKATKEILDYMAQRIEIDRNPLLDTDIHAVEGTSLENYVRSSEEKRKPRLYDTQLGIVPDQSHTGSLTVDGIQYTSSANAYAIPKEVAEIFNIPDMPKGFAKKYVDNINRLKASVVGKNEFHTDLDYLDSFSLMESPNYPADYTRMMKALQGRNTGALKKVFKMFEDKPVEIVLETRQPDLPAGAHNPDEISIGVPTIDDTFDLTLAQHLLNHHLVNDKHMLDDLTGVWGRLMYGENWFEDFEPELITRFLHFAVRHDMPEGFKNVIAHYHKQLGVENIEFGYRGRTQSMIDNFREYPDRMLSQGNSLQGALRELPDDVRKAFASFMSSRTPDWSNADDFLRDFDSMINTFGVSGSQMRNQFQNISRSPQHILHGMLNKGTFDALDKFDALWPRVAKSPNRNPIGYDRHYSLKELWTSQEIPYEQSVFTGRSSLDAVTQLAEEAVGIKGLRDVFERVIDTPLPPRTDRVVDYFVSNKTIADVTGKSSVMIDIPLKAAKSPEDAVSSSRKEAAEGWLERERKIKYKTLPDPKVREPLTWKPFQRALRGTRSVVDRVREVGLTEEAKKFAHITADKLNATQNDESVLMGQFLERIMLANSEVKISVDEANLLGDFQHQRWRAHLGLIDKIDDNLIEAFTANPRLRYFDRALENIYRDTRTYANDIGMLVESYRGGKIMLGPGKHTPEYTAEVISQDVRRILMKSPTQSDEYNNLREEAIAYWKKIADKSTKDELDTALSDVDIAREVSLEKKLGAMFDSMAGSLKATEHKIGSQKYKALRVATGKFGIPPNWVERNALQRLTRYIARFAKDAAFFKNIEGDETARKILGIPDQAGNYSPQDLKGLERGGPFNVRGLGKTKGKAYNKPALADHETLDAFMQGYAGYYQNWDLWTRTFNRMVTSSWLGVGAGIRDFVSSYPFALPYMRVQDWPIFVTHLYGFRKAWIKSHDMGVNKTSLGNIEWRMQSVNEISDGINKAADVMLVLGGRNILERGTRTLQYALGRQLTWTSLRLRPIESLGIPDWTANRLLRTLDQQMGGGANYQGRRVSLFDYVGKIAPEEVMDQAAKAWVEINQGTYDVRGLPKFTQRGVPSMFTSLARWSIEKSDRMLKDVWMPLRNELDPLPLVKATFGAVLVGEAIKYISEEIANKIQSDPKLIEAIQMENPKEMAHAILNSVAFAGFFGYQSSLLHDLVRSSRYGVLEGIPGGFTFPAADAGFTILKDFFHLMSSGEAFDKGFASAWTKFARNTLMGLNQTMRYGFQHVLLSDEMSEFNARAQFRKFRRLEEGYVRPGVPSGLSNEFANPAKKEFQKANSVAEARRLLPAAMSEAAQNAMDKHPNNPANQNKQFQDNWKALYDIQWTATGAMPYTRGEQEHLRRMRYLGLKGTEQVEKQMYRGKGDVSKFELGGVPIGKIVGGDMMRGTIISKRRAKKLMMNEQEFLKLRAQKKNLVLRIVGSRGRVY